MSGSATAFASARSPRLWRQPRSLPALPFQRPDGSTPTTVSSIRTAQLLYTRWEYVSRWAPQWLRRCCFARRCSDCHCISVHGCRRLHGAPHCSVWHVLPAMATISDSAALTGMSGRVGRAGAVAGAVVATTVGGIVFAELRRRSGSVVAPILLHATVNVAAFAAARWSRTREGDQLSPATTRPDSYATTTA